jgi:AraC family cel operon transcriptional repressor
MAVPRLLLNEFIRRGEAYHFARVTLSGTRSTPGHRHNFHEVFWVEEGRGLHVINGLRRDLFPGLCLAIQAHDVHSLHARPGHNLTIINVAFPIATWAALRRRYFARRPDFFGNPVVRREFDLSRLLSSELASAAGDLGQGVRSRLKIERFLINLFYRLSDDTSSSQASGLPDWLDRACRKIREEKAFAGGVPAFARLAGRCPEHLSRQVRRFMNTTPTDIVNEARLAHAAQALAGSRESISGIALDCGVENLSHFYSLFRRSFGCTPRQYRLRHQRIVE